jgi:hypothetical protein
MPSADLRAILLARIAALEEHARTLKALSETKQQLADSQKQSEKSERTRQIALEHKKEALATLQAAQVLKVIVDKRTRAEQIAVMRHYVLEYGQSAVRNARLNDSLADGDPRKEDADDDGIAATFVQSVLDSILSDVAAEPPERLSLGPLRRTISLLCALTRTSVSAFCLIYLLFYAARFKVWMPVSAAVFMFVGLYWLWADFINADPRPEK